MSILKKPYELSIWKDVWNNSSKSFTEERIGVVGVDVTSDGALLHSGNQGVIGSDTMTHQGRALQPKLTRNTNGTKKFSFKMYRYYVDNITGEKTENPFIAELISERKVKLKYGKRKNSDGTETDIWYDFIIKNISENSSDYSYTYQLEDALVQELSKNGFGVVLDEKLRDSNGLSNMGTAKELAEKVLQDTDWSVESEVFVQKVDEALVYITIDADTTVTRIFDQTDLNEGIQTQEITLEKNTTALAFYSSCTGKPHRFQFIILGSYEKDDVRIDDKRIILEPNCQYYLEVDGTTVKYSAVSEFTNMYLPTGCTIFDKGSGGVSDTTDSTVSYWYRGNRYGFAQRAEFVSLVEKYCNKYKKIVDGAEVDYFGYSDIEYLSPIFVQDVITNGTFKGTSGWVGTYMHDSSGTSTKADVAVQVEDVYGRFVSNEFTSAIQDMLGGVNTETTTYKSYLKLTIPKKKSGVAGTPILLNTGFYDLRTSTETVAPAEKWILNTRIVDSTGALVVGTDTDNDNGSKTYSSNISFELAEVDYQVGTESYTTTACTQVLNKDNCDDYKNDSGYFLVFNHTESISKEDFKNKEIKLVIKLPQSTEADLVYYIEKMELYRAVASETNDNGVTVAYFTPGQIDEDGIVKNVTTLFKVSDLSSVTKADDLACETVYDLDYNIYKPVYNRNAEKVRAVAAKESNYFNILQSIAETFEAWLTLQVTRDTSGRILSKSVCFKNYAGNDNYASFQYGVNLKNIQRTFASKNIVTKLIVKQNNNEFAQNKFCTIARAKSNPTGENYIYDFQYYHQKGLLDADDYYQLVHTTEGAVGPDVNVSGTTNLQGYFPRIKNINNAIEPLNIEITNIQVELVKLNANKEVQTGLLRAAEEGMEETSNEFRQLFGADINSINEFNIEPITPTITLDSSYAAAYDVILRNATGLTRGSTIQFDISKKAGVQVGYEFLTHNLSGGNSLVGSGSYTLTLVEGKPEHCGIKVVPTETYEGQASSEYETGHRYRLTYDIKFVNSHDSIRIGGHVASFEDVVVTVRQGDTLIARNHGVDANLKNVAANTIYTVTVEGKYIFNKYDRDINTNYMYIQPNKGNTNEASCLISNISLQDIYVEDTAEIGYTVTIKDASGEDLTEEITGGANTKVSRVKNGFAAEQFVLEAIDETNTKVVSLVEKYLAYEKQYEDSYDALNNETTGINTVIETKEDLLETKQEAINTLLDNKAQLNKLFFETYSRFIQEGTWMKEDYYDDEKYYTDAQSVMYNSCYPQVQYTINVLELSALPGYELFTFELGDKTKVVDPEFFGSDLSEEIIVTELTESLDDPSQNTIKVQNFKNQFQDLFQKITASVQQTQYSTGSYEKAAALAEADAKHKGEFLNDALAFGVEKFSLAGQTSVVQDASGITLTDEQTQDQMRLIGGAIMMSVQDENGLRQWKTGLTPEGISATMVTAGTLNAGNIAIMNVDEPVFRWDAFGITAYDAEWYANNTIGPANYRQFVRFDKYGLYGIGEDGGKDGRSWKPMSEDEIDLNSTFALTWEGLKVVSTNENGKKTSLRIGNNAKTSLQDNTLLSVKNDSGETTFAITNNGSIIWGSGEDNGSSPFQMLYSSEKSQPEEKPENDRLWSSYPQTGTTEWHRAIQPTDWYASYTSNGGATWSVPIRIVGANTSEIIEWYYATSDVTEQPTRTSVTWSKSPSAAVHDAVNKYLWNYEETVLSNGTSKYSSPALITTQPKSIDKIYEFYLVTSTASAPDKPTNFSWNGAELTYTNTNPTWECIDTSNVTSASSLRAAQSEYMWNFEVICYDDATCSVGSIANIGTGGKGIDTIVEYYARTKTTNKAPTDTMTTNEEAWGTDLKTPTSDWPYLWNYEVSKYSNGEIAASTQPVIIAYYTEDGRGIESIDNYYLINTGELPELPTLSTEENKYEEAPENPIAGVWYKTAPKTTIINEYLWNCEIIKYTKVDDKGVDTSISVPSVIGTHGASPYTISLDQDFVSVQSDNLGTVSWFPDISITPKVFYGDVEQTFTINATKGLGLFVTNNGLYGEWNADGKTYKFNDFDLQSDRGTFSFVLKKDNKEVAHAQFEAVKQMAGGDAVYKYALADYETINVDDFPASLTIQIQQVVGNGTPQIYTGTCYYKISIDGKDFSTADSVTLALGDEGKFQIEKSKYENASKNIRIDIYSNPECTSLIDKLTISIIKDGENGQGTFMLFHDLTTDGTTPALPAKETSWYDFPLYSELAGDKYPKTGWYRGQTEANTSTGNKGSAYCTMRIATKEEETTVDWNPVQRTSGVLSTRQDLLDLLQTTNDGKLSDGIYAADGNIAINATAIKTGYLCVGEVPTFDVNGYATNIDKCRFYVNVDDPSIALIGGWYVSEDGFQYMPVNEIYGGAGSVGLFPRGITIDDWPGNDYLSENDQWVITAGDSFGVTKNGMLYANSGRIGSMTIGDINDLDSRVTDAQKAADDAQKDADGAKEAADNAAGEASLAHQLAESAVQDYVDSNNFSWKFDSEKGLYMYNGAQANEDEIFKIYKDGTKYKAWLTGEIYATNGTFQGHVEASSGSIGGFSMSETAAYSPSMSATSSAASSRAPVLRYIADNLQTEYNEYYNGVAFGKIELITRNGKNSNNCYKTALNSKSLRLNSINDGGKVVSLTQIEPGTIETLVYTNDATGREELGFRIYSDYSYDGNNTITQSATRITFSEGNKQIFFTKIPKKEVYDENNFIRFTNNYGPIVFYTNNKAINIESLYNQVQNLGFKGPYNISLGSTVIGKIAQLGHIVYGFIDSSKFSTYSNDTTLSISGTVSPPPFTNDYMRVVVPYSGGSKCCQMNVSNSGGSLKLVLTKYWNNTGDLDNCDGYFCYSAVSEKQLFYANGSGPYFG